MDSRVEIRQVELREPMDWRDVVSVVILLPFVPLLLVAGQLMWLTEHLRGRRLLSYDDAVAIRAEHRL